MSQTNWEADKMLDVYIHDYLVKRDLKASAQAFQAEGKVSSDPVAIDAPGGFLFEWWSVFWDIFIARTNEKHSEVAASYIEIEMIDAVLKTRAHLFPALLAKLFLKFQMKLLLPLHNSGWFMYLHGSLVFIIFLRTLNPLSLMACLLASIKETGDFPRNRIHYFMKRSSLLVHVQNEQTLPLTQLIKAREQQQQQQQQQQQPQQPQHQQQQQQQQQLQMQQLNPSNSNVEMVPIS
ncbi:unnamed protein product, partial [Vitis vinifera]